jgi:hypothetical protein
VCAHPVTSETAASAASSRQITAVPEVKRIAFAAFRPAARTHPTARAAAGFTGPEIAYPTPWRE